ncbi:MAG: glycosyltransferase family 4 protein [Brevundimonas sp.]|uniref:glycosyltransferase family 4 protein n=1 Tax=Brevundimonas sp. TaxID=1871086 RepID=UPI00273630B4|nr:glycosyltransferase family 4 protein [Brevundimonas sp.]MDP3403908.1 glycosyltransferase family 4 protein [Brevundimonas sp.]
MSNAALYLNPEAYDTTGKALMGRQSAGESFLRGYLQHARTDHAWFWNVANRPEADLTAFIERINPVGRPSTVIARHDRAGLGRAGNVFLTNPNLAREAWARRTAGLTTTYGITCITHTTASEWVMDSIANMLTAPIEPWDRLICTSAAVRASVEVELEAVRNDLEIRMGATRVPEPKLATIPLGINTADFAVTAEQRAEWRRTLDIPDDGVVVLYIGRFNHHAKMNPLPMAMALERAAKATTKKVYWVQAGWGTSPAVEAAYHDQCRKLCPTVGYRVVDGRPAGTRFSIWSVADLFLSLSDNIQETFGLTPIEAMAAGLPCVVSDWNGYRDTVRHGVDGFRVSTYAPASGAGGDLAYRHANGWLTYDQYVGSASQLTAVDIGETAKALLDLIEDPDLRQGMGERARERARAIFDWSQVIPQYEALWAGMTEDRLAANAVELTPRNLAPDPRRLDPFHLFGGYPSEWLSPSTMVMLTPGRDGALDQLLTLSMGTHGGNALPTVPELRTMVDRLAERPQITAAELAERFPEGRRSTVQRGLLFLAKYDIVTILPRNRQIAS